MHEDGCGDGLDGFAQVRKREAMNPLQDAALAPLDFKGCVVRGLGAFKDSAHGKALHFHREECLL